MKSAGKEKNETSMHGYQNQIRKLYFSK